VSELDGLWEVRRVSGALPPMAGVRKRIAGESGETIVAGGPRLAFDVVGLELRYRPPFAWLVDVIEPTGAGFRGRATAFGRTYGQFELRRIDMNDAQGPLVKHIDEAHALEQSVLRLLDGAIQTTHDPEIADRLRQHRGETEQHAATMRRRLEAHDAQPSLVRQAAGIFEALAKLPLDVVRGEKAGRNARDAYAAEHLEIASYELLRRVAERAGDEETARACVEILDQERAMASFLDENWDRFAALSLEEQGAATG
jgi:ferritin-like metal-binding protein YciE